jgi:hypothetical protein
MRCYDVSGFMSNVARLSRGMAHRLNFLTYLKYVKIADETSE